MAESIRTQLATLKELATKRTGKSRAERICAHMAALDKAPLEIKSAMRLLVDRLYPLNVTCGSAASMLCNPELISKQLPIDEEFTTALQKCTQFLEVECG